MLADLGALGDVAEAREVHVGARGDHDGGAGRRACRSAAARFRPAMRQRAGGLEHRAGLLEGVLDRGADLVGRDRDDVVEVARGRARTCARRPAVTATPSAKRPTCSSTTRAPGRERARHRVGVVGLDADDPDLGPELLHHRREPRREPAAADRHEDAAEVARRLVQDLETDRRPAPRSRRDRRRAGSASCRSRRRPRRNARRRPRSRRRRARPRRRERRTAATLIAGVVRGITIRAADAETRRRVGDALRVVAGRGGDHARRALARRKLRDPVVGAAKLEREDRRQVLALQEHRASETRREAGRGIERRRRRAAPPRRARSAPASASRSWPWLSAEMSSPSTSGRLVLK